MQHACIFCVVTVWIKTSLPCPPNTHARPTVCILEPRMRTRCCLGLRGCTRTAAATTGSGLTAVRTLSAWLGARKKSTYAGSSYDGQPLGYFQLETLAYQYLRLRGYCAVVPLCINRSYDHRLRPRAPGLSSRRVPPSSASRAASTWGANLTLTRTLQNKNRNCLFCCGSSTRYVRAE